MKTLHFIFILFLISVFSCKSDHGNSLVTPKLTGGECVCPESDCSTYILYEVEEIKKKLNFNKLFKPIGFYFIPLSNGGRYIFQVHIEYSLRSPAYERLDHAGIGTLGNPSIYTPELNEDIGFCGEYIQFFLKDKPKVPCKPSEQDTIVTKVPSFTNTYIGYYTLKHILDNSEFLAIAGGQMNAGKFYIKDNEVTKEGVDLMYSTLKFMGYNKKKGKEINHILKIEPSMIEDDEGKKVPVETILAPCPPRWVPRKKE